MSSFECRPDVYEREAQYADLKAYVLAETGFAYYADRDDDFLARVRTRMSELGLVRVGDYLEFLRGHRGGEPELEVLIERLTVGETHFFRHQEIFDALRDVVGPTLLQDNRSGPVRIWSAACSTGAEAYSVSISLRREVGIGHSARPVSILGTDVNRSALRRAKRGEYTEWDLRGMPEQFRPTCFVHREGNWVIRPEFQEGVEFRYHNLVRHPYPSLVNNLIDLDLILCRNVLIYFDEVTVRRVVGRLFDCLADGGWLLVGHAEPSIALFAAFETVNAPGAVLYRKTVGTSVGRPGKPVVLKRASPRANEMPSARPTATARAGRLRAAPRPARRESASPSADRDAWLRRVRESADRGDLRAVDGHCTARAAADPLDAAPYLYLALVAEQRGRYPEAVALIRKTLYADRSIAVAHYHLGILLRRSGELAAARLAYQNVGRHLAASERDPVPYADGLTVEDIRKLVALELAELGP